MVKIDDISKATGFSRTTISKALNDKSDISEKTKEIVRKAAKELNYIPNINARNLRKKRNNIIAVIISSPSKESEKTNSLYPLLLGVNKFLEENDLELALYIIDSEKQIKKSYIKFCKERNVIGAILVGIKTDDIYLKQLINSDLPCVLIDINIKTDSNNISIVQIDDFKASCEAVQYLIDNGHTNIVYLNGVKNSTVSVDRLKGYKATLRKNKLLVNEDYIVEADFSEKKAEEKTNELLIKHPEVTAIFSASDLMALGAMSAIEKLKLKIPEDISIIGFDDIPIAYYLKPGLTTIAQSFYEKGLESAKLIWKQLNNEVKGEVVTLVHQLVIRDSVRKLK